MSFVLEAVRDKPVALFLMDGTSPFQDYSGYSQSGTVTGTPTRTAALVRGAKNAPVITKNTPCIFGAPVFRRGFEQQPFSLEATIRSVQSTNGLTAQTYRENIAQVPVPQAVVNEGTQWRLTHNYWGAQSTPTIETTGGPWGTKFYRKTITASTNNTNGRYIIGQNADATTLTPATSGIPVTPGQTITLSMLVRYSLAITQDRFAYQFWDSTGQNKIGVLVNTAYSTLVQGKWSRMSFTVTVPDGAGLIGVRTDTTLTGVGATFDATALLVELTDTVKPYFDGSWPGVEWSGTAWASSSRKRKDVARINYAPNPSVETTATPIATYGGTSGVVTSGRQTGGSILGTAFYRMTWTTGATALGGGVYQTFNVVGGLPYTISSYLRTNRTQKMLCRLEWKDAAGTLITQVPGPTTAMTANSWSRVAIINAIAPATATTLTATFYNVDVGSTNWQVGDTLDSDGFLFEQSDTLGTFFDGTTPGGAWGVSDPSWSYLLPSTGEQQILGKSGTMDGLLLNGTVVSFVNKFTTAPEARISYDLQHHRRAHVVGTRDSNKISLYVEGTLVAEQMFTEAQAADTFASSDTNLNSGSSSTSQGFAVNGIGVYASVLTPDAVQRHYQAASQLPDGEDVAGSLNGYLVPVSIDNQNVFLDQTWASKIEWDGGMYSNTACVADRLVPQFDGDISMPGQWSDVFFIGAANVTSIYGVSFDWEGEGAVIEASLDGLVWETVQRGKNLAMIPPGTNPTDRSLQVRVTFPGGILNDTSYLDNLNAVGLISNLPSQVHGRTITLTNTSNEREYPPLAYNDNWGAEIAAGGSIVIGPDTSNEAIPVRTVEVWIKPTDATTMPTVSASGTTYYNGSTSGALAVGQWTLLHVVASADITGSVTINGPAQVGQVILYPTALSATEVTRVYNTYTGNQVLHVDDSDVIAVAEPVSGTQIYAYDWSIVAS